MTQSMHIELDLWKVHKMGQQMILYTAVTQADIHIELDLWKVHKMGEQMILYTAVTQADASNKFFELWSTFPVN